MTGLSPMMQHYMELKSNYKDCIVFYRLGDFYEMFFDDALTASKELEITLTGRDCGLEERAPMCGVPFHSADAYINRLVQKGYKVAIAEQMEDPKLAKGLVKREVIRVVTPGTILSAQALDESKNNYLMCVVYADKSYGIAVVDVSTGDFMLTEVSDIKVLIDEIFKFMPSEIICNEAFYVSGIDLEDIRNRVHSAISALPNHYFSDDICVNTIKEHFKVDRISGLGIEEYGCGVTAAGAVLIYLMETQKNTLSNITKISPYQTGRYMIIDTSTRRNLELTETLREKQKRGSLLWVLDKTKTAMGARTLRSYIEQPLIDRSEILKRQAAIEEFNEEYINREEIAEYLNPIYDLERLMGRICYQTANPRDLIAFKNSLSMLPHIKRILAQFKSKLLKEICSDLDTLEDITALIEASIVDDPPILVREGGMIKEGYNEEADRLRKAKTDGKDWLMKLESDEKEKTGIKNLRVKYNKVFGYYIEVTNSYLSQVPDYYVRKQTLTNAERFTTKELKELEDIILGAEDRLYALEYELFSEVRLSIAKEVLRIQKTAKAIAAVDVLVSLSVVAMRNNYVKPSINEKNIIDIKDGRHPVVELMLRDDQFIPNDTYLDGKDNRISVITGPNMAGKSTYMRQAAIICLMAQIGSFVPAGSADICISDRIFTRVGASDDLASGQSTFMVEMTEVANILRNATKNSLLILDEIGRGTSTFDGLSIAWAVIEYISNTKIIGAKTLFATHYHELTELEGCLSGVNNYCIAVKEVGDDIIFLRKIVRGGADKSYGIQVAKLAGVPDMVIQRAKEIVEELVSADITVKTKEIATYCNPMQKNITTKPDDVELSQMTLFDTAKDDDIIEELKNLDITIMTPIDALNVLNRLQNKLKNRW
ncbi:MAG: DNA mismatch repair protein MutS [Lachnospiraceae bacterium]|nr:DNA mismatch repair protein MutS [Lachnospiraceae bacterium]